MVNVDTKLLVIFVELLSKRNATYVAEKMHMTAPAVSHSLGRLREIFDDPLFIRVPHGLTPTPKALELGPKVREMLTRVDTKAPVARTRNFVICPQDFMRKLGH